MVLGVDLQVFSLTSPLNGNKKILLDTWPSTLCFRNSGEIIYPMVNIELIVMFFNFRKISEQKYTVMRLFIDLSSEFIIVH